MNIRRMRVLSLAIILTASGCAKEAPTAPPTAPQELKVGVLSSWDQLPYYVMQSQRLGQKHGLKITGVPAPGGAAIVDGIAAGTMDVGFIGTVPAFAAAQAGKIPSKMVLIGGVAIADPSHRSLALLVGASIKSWADLQGKDVAVNSPNSIGGAALKIRLLDEGVAGVNLVSIAFENQGLAVGDGLVAGAVMLEPFITQSLLRGDGTILDWMIGGGEPFPHFQITAMAFSAEKVKNDPALVKRFLRAYLDSLDWIDAHPKGSRALIARELSLTDEVASKINVTRFAKDGRNDPRLLGQIQQQMLRLTPDQKPIDISTFYDETLLNQVLKE